MIDWSSPRWGELGHNVHEASDGSWVDTEPSDDEVAAPGH
jgi:hypothetical protein